MDVELAENGVEDATSGDREKGAGVYDVYPRSLADEFVGEIAALFEDGF